MKKQKKLFQFSYCMDLQEQGRRSLEAVKILHLSGILSFALHITMEPPITPLKKTAKRNSGAATTMLEINQ